MFDHLRGGIVSAKAGERSKLSLRFNQAMTTVLVGGPFAGAVYALVRLGWDRPNATDLALLGSLYVATALGITVGFHRLATHKSFETPPIIKGILLVFGTFSIQGAVISWIAIHSKHHVKSDTEEDPHSPTRSFFHGHMGWLWGTVRAEPERYAKAQLQDPVVMLVSRTGFWWAAVGLAIPFAIGGWSGFLWGSLIRVFLVHHVTWSVNSVCHRFGSRPYRTAKDLSTNNWIVGLLALGEGWHNNHHAFPRSAFHGLKRRQVDLSAQFIRLLGALRLARAIYRVPETVIEARRGAARSTPAA